MVYAPLLAEVPARLGGDVAGSLAALPFAASPLIDARVTPHRSIAVFLLAVASLTIRLPADAAPALTESYDGPTPSWRLPENPGAARIITQQRVRIDREEAPAGVEHVRFACPAGYSGVFLHLLGKAPVLAEWNAQVSFRGGRPGAQLAARVVFPQKAEAVGANKEPLYSIVRGAERYEEPGAWQTLSIDDLPRLVKRQARMLRAQGRHPSLDEKGAYVDCVALIVPGGSTGAEFWTDELVVEGVLVDEDDDKADQTDDAPEEHSVLNPESQTSQQSSLAVEPFSPAHGFRNGGSAFFPVVAWWQGEPFKTLHDLGFNTVALPQRPTAEQLTEARDLGLRIVCPPPSEPSAPRESASEATLQQALDTILAWRLSGSDELTLDAAQPLVARLRSHASWAARPLLVAPGRDFAPWSRLADGLVLPSGVSPFVGDRFAEAASQARPGTPLIARITLTHARRAQDQLRALAPTGKASAWRDPNQIEAAVWAAIAAGAEGLWFESSEPLAGAGIREQHATATVGLINLQVALVEPWLVAGERIGSIAGPGAADQATLFRRGRTKLVLFTAPPEPQRDAATQREGASPTFQRGPPGLVLPSISETAFAYTMSPAGLTRIPLERELGGMAIDPAAIEVGTPVLLTDDSVAVRNLGRRIASSARRAVTLQQSLAEAEMRAWRSVMSGGPDGTGQASSPVTAAVTRWISRSKAAQAAGDLPTAYNAAVSARSLLRRAEVEFDRKLNPSEQLLSSPLARQPATWVDEFRLRELLRALPRSGNLLAGGDFENLEVLRKTGWRHAQTADGGGDVSISARDPKHGARCLTLHGSGKRASAPSWIVSPATPLRAGQLVEVTGWARFQAEGEAAGSLAIVDSLGGEELAISVPPGEGWRPFRMIRRPAERTSLQLTFAVIGAGEASVDAVMIRPVLLEASPRSPLEPSLSETARGGRPQPRSDQLK